ncbi:hypothetical protein [Streptomyces hydrogenans]|uniref:hypothetical protein n=1 Tax=Streptomyces hydrogenans TaxID=1873719 RepID=UPI0033EBE58C
MGGRRADRPHCPAAAPQAAPAAAPGRRRAREHHEECDGELYEGGNCTCDLIERYGPNSERDDY